MMPADELDARYIKEYKKMPKEYAIMAAKHPDVIDQLRAVLSASSVVMISNSPETVLEFRRLAEELDSFLGACQTGEVDPHAFIRSLDDEGS
jgi:hypothetical protein